MKLQVFYPIRNTIQPGSCKSLKSVAYKPISNMACPKPETSCVVYYFMAKTFDNIEDHVNIHDSDIKHLGSLWLLFCNIKRFMNGKLRAYVFCHSTVCLMSLNTMSNSEISAQPVFF